MADPNDQMGGAGTPRGGGPAVPRVDTQNLDVALATMARIAEQTEASTKATVELVRHLERVSRTSRDVGRNLDGWGTEFTAVMRNSANLEYTIKRIQKLQAQRVGGGASRSGTAEYIQQLQKEYKLLLQVLNTGKGQGRYVKEVDAALKGLDSTLKRVRKSNEATWDADAIQEVNRTLQETAQRVGDVQRAMSKVQVQKMTQGFHEMRKTMDDAFGGQFSQMLRRIPGVAKIMQATQFRRQAGAAQQGLKTLSSQRMAMRQEAWKGAAREAVKTHGPGAMQHLRTLGYTGGRPVGNKLMPVGPLKAGGRRTIGGASAGVSQVGGSTVARAGGSLEQMSVKTMVVQQMVQGKNAAKELARADAKAGRRARFNPKTGELVGQQAETPAARTRAKRESAKSIEELATRLRGNPMGNSIIKGLRRKVGGEAPDIDSVASTVAGQGGGFLSRGFNKAVTRVAEASGGRGLLGKLSTGLLSRGAGSATSGLAAGATGIGSSLLSGGLQVASKAAVPLAIVGAIVSMHDKIAAENKKIQESLGGMGIHGTGRGGVNFHNVRKSLLSTGLTGAAMWGQGQAENMKLMNTIGESGLAVGGSLRRGVDLGAAFEQRGDLQGDGFYGSIMKNALVGGRNLGMGQDQSARLTLKLVEKFGKTMESTQDFFLQMDDMMASSGVTASKYIDIIDAVGDQFNDMNRSLTNSVSLLNTVGKNGRLTGEAMEKLMKGLQTPNQMSMAQRMFSAQGMKDSGDNLRAANSLDAGMARDMEALHIALTKAGVTGVGKADDIADKRQDIELQLAEKLKDRPEELKALVDNLEKTLNRRTMVKTQSDALRSGDALAIASVAQLGGESGPLAMYAKQNTLKQLAQIAGFNQSDTQALLANDPRAVQRFLSSGVAAKAVESGVFQSDQDMMAAIQAQGRVRQQGALYAMQFGREAENVDSLRDGKGWSKQGQTILALQRARGVNITGDGSDAIKAFMKEAKGDKSAALQKELERLDETFSQVTSQGSALEEALKTQTDQAAKDAAQEKARKIVAETRPVADVFAKSFEYLIDKLVNMMDKMMSVLSPEAWFKFKGDERASKQWDDDRDLRIADLASRVDQNKLSEAEKRDFDTIEARRKSNYYRTGTVEERDKKTHEAADLLTKFVTKTNSAQQASAAHQRANAVEMIHTLGYSYTKDMGRQQGGLTTASSGPIARFQSLDEAIEDATGHTGNGVATIGKLLANAVKSAGGSGDAAMGVLGGLGHWKAFNWDTDKRGRNIVAATDAHSEAVLEAIKKQNPEALKAGGKDAQGNTYYIISTPIHTAAAAAPGAAAGAAKNHAQQVKDPQK